MPDTTPTRQRAHGTDAGRRLRPERATALMLVPALMLVLLSLGAIAVDLTALHGAHRRAHRVVSAAADDAAGMLDSRLIQETGELRIDPEAAGAVVTAHLDSASLPGTQIGPTQVTVSDDGTAVLVAVHVRIEHVLLPSLPGSDQADIVTVSATGRLEP